VLSFYNSLGGKKEIFRPVNKAVVNIFTCGPSVYQRAHIGNFRTFLFEDVLVRYLQYSGYRVKRGMIFTDIEDKAIAEAIKTHSEITSLTADNIHGFLEEMKTLGMLVPDYLPKASEHVDAAVDLIERLLEKRIAYWHAGNVYFDPLCFDGFGKLYGLDMSRWPKKKRRFHKDTYPGVQWNLGDFILWHGCKGGEKNCWETKIGRGRPSWNIQDPSMICGLFDETLSIYCGGEDNLYRHHDYTIAILESLRPYPMAAYWLHCRHLYVEGHKMSKSKGNVYYTDTVLAKGYSAAELRFFLIYGHYRSRLNYRSELVQASAIKLRNLRKIVSDIRKRAGQEEGGESGSSERLIKAFTNGMDNDLDVKAACDEISAVLEETMPAELDKKEAAGIVKTLRGIDGVLKVLF